MIGSRLPAPNTCITCGDVAVPMRVVATGGEDGLAECVTEEGDAAAVDVGLIDDVTAGDAVLVHAFVAIQRLASPSHDPGTPDHRETNSEAGAV